MIDACLVGLGGAACFPPLALLSTFKLATVGQRMGGSGRLQAVDSELSAQMASHCERLRTFLPLQTFGETATTGPHARRSAGFRRAWLDSPSKADDGAHMQQVLAEDVRGRRLLQQSLVRPRGETCTSLGCPFEKNNHPSRTQEVARSCPSVSRFASREKKMAAGERSELSFHLVAYVPEGAGAEGK